MHSETSSENYECGYFCVEAISLSMVTGLRMVATAVPGSCFVLYGRRDLGGGNNDGQLNLIERPEHRAGCICWSRVQIGYF